MRLNENMMKKMYAGLASIVLIMALTGCGGSNIQESETASLQKSTAEDNSNTEEEPFSPQLGFSDSNLEKLYEIRHSMSDHADFSGEWKRTAVHSSLSADIVIERVDDEGFDFSGEFYYYSHSGELAGKAFYISKNQAIYKQFEDDDIDHEPAYIGFSLTDTCITVISSGFVEGMGMNVSVNGDYIQDEPYYTNENVVAENFSEDDLLQLKELLREETYNELFLNNTEIGNVTSEAVKLSDGTISRHIECFVPTMGDGYDLLITEDGRYYFFHENSDLFATNDSNYSDWRIPDYTVSSDEEENSESKSPFVLWEYEGYVDECEGYYWQDEFKDCDYDGDGKKDRLNRKWDGNEQIALYTIEFGNGNKLEVPKGWETGFPHVQSGDLDGDNVKEILVTLSYDTSTDPLSFGDIWLFDYDDSTSEYKEISLPLTSGENGAKGFTISYDKPEDLVIRYTIKETGLSRSEEVNDDYINSWWTNEKTTEMRSVYWAEMRKGKNPAVRCYVEPLPRSGVSLGFDLYYRNGKYDIGYVELDTPEGPF